MRRAAVLTALVAAGGLAALLAQEPAALPPVGPIQKVRNNLYVIPGQGGNTAMFVTRTGVVLVDTKVAGNGPALMERVAAVSDVPVTMIINTHSHADHVGGNGFFSPAVEIVAHEHTKAAMTSMAELRDAPHALPDRTFGDRLTIGRGQDRIDLYYVGRGHTNGDVLVVFPAVRAMHAGDLFAWKMAPLVDTAHGGSATAYPETLDAALKTIPNVDTVIPGHGEVTTWSAFAEYADFIRALTASARASKQAGRSPQQAAADLTLPPRFADYLGDRTLAGLEFAGTAAARASAFVSAVYAEAR